MVKKKDLVFTHGVMEEDMKGSGKKENKMAKAIFIKKRTILKEFGLWVFTRSLMQRIKCFLRLIDMFMKLKFFINQ